MTKVSIEQHLEKMDPELDRVDITLNISGYKVDGDNGIKNIVNLPNRKSIDYFYLKGSNCIFLEFSDIARQKEDHLETISKMNGCDQDVKNKFKKLFRNGLRSECLAKFKDSRDILAKFPEFYSDLHAPLLSNDAKEFWLIHAPIYNELSDGQKAKITRYLSTLKTSISSGLEDEICSRVRLQFVEQLEQL